MKAPVELLVLKAGQDYFRIEGEALRPCGLDKASVFPVSALDTVREHRARLRDGGFPESQICRLTVHEEPLRERGQGCPPTVLPGEGVS